MLVLDENLPEGQRLWLRKWRIHFRAVGIEVAASGTKDSNLIPTHERAWPSGTPARRCGGVGYGVSLALARGVRGGPGYAPALSPGRSRGRGHRIVGGAGREGA